MKILKKLITISAIFTVSLFIFGAIWEIRNQHLLNEFTFTTGKIYSCRKKKHDYVIKYDYSVGGVKYNGTEIYSYLLNCDSMFAINNLKIKYSKKDPSVSEIEDDRLKPTFVTEDE